MLPVCDAHSSTTFGRVRTIRTPPDAVASAVGAGAAAPGTLAGSVRLNSPASMPSSQNRTGGVSGAPAGSTGTPPSRRPAFAFSR